MSIENEDKVSTAVKSDEKAKGDKSELEEADLDQVSGGGRPPIAM